MTTTKKALLIGNCQVKSLAETLNLFVADMAFDHLQVHSLPPGSAEAYLAEQARAANEKYDLFLSFDLSSKFFCLSRDTIRDTFHGRDVLFISNLWFDGYFPDIVTLGSTQGRIDGPLAQYHSKIALFGFMSGWSEDETVAAFSEQTYAAAGYFENWADAIRRLSTSDQTADIRFGEEMAALVQADLCMFVVNHPTPVVFHRWADVISRSLSALGLASRRQWMPHEALVPAHFVGTSAFPFYPELASRAGLARLGSYCFKAPGTQSDSVLTLPEFVRREFATFGDAGKDRLAQDPRWPTVQAKMKALPEAVL